MAVHPASGATPPVLDDLVYNRPPGHFTDADLEQLPEGYGYEIVDGTLFVSPAPDAAHQLLVGELHLQLRLACPAELAVLLAPFDYKPDKDTTFEPDLLVARRVDVVGAKRLERRPLLVVEVRSGRGLRDRTFKRAAYEEAGAPSYWLADANEPSLTVLELNADGRYVEHAHIAGGEPLRVERPYPVELRLPNG